MMIPQSKPRYQIGFTLAEIAIVLFIVALLLGGMLMGLGARIDLRNRSATQDLLKEATDALLGFAAANGRLPCPATASSMGDESTTGIAGASPCTNPWGGFLPGRTLGTTQLDANGLVPDGWGNPIRYAVTTATINAFVESDGIRREWSGGLSPDLRICVSGASVSDPGTATADCPSASRQTANAVAVIYSLGKNGGLPAGGTGRDESHNPNPRTTIAADRVFISHEPTAAGTAGGEFDDMVTWLSPNILYNRMIAAGRLP
ncbi:MAG: prepilin-type N-terminal cleavage/methylation domain-containing protein [Candidatus Methylophosphatis roskildensis]